MPSGSEFSVQSVRVSSFWFKPGASQRARNNKPETRNQKLETLNPEPVHSYLNATIGSTLAARRAGTKQAASATPVSSTEITTKVSGSVAVTPNNNVDISREDPNKCCAEARLRNRLREVLFQRADLRNR
jgi:hypothetical protein